MNPLNILVVEDDPIASSMLKSILDTTCHRHFFVTEGEDGIDFLKNPSFGLSRSNGLELAHSQESPSVDVILLDYHLPKMNGRTFCQLVRTMPDILSNHPYLWIIAHSSERRLDLMQEVFEAGANDYLPKPIIPDVFLLRLLVAQYSTQRQKHIQRRLSLKEKIVDSVANREC